MALIRLRRRRSQAHADRWNRFSVITGFLSGVVVSAVVGGVGLLMQHRANQLSERNAKAQLEFSRQQAESEKRIQEGQLAATFVDHLRGKDASQREIAVIAMRASIPDELCDRILSVVARTDASPDVRARAIEQLALSDSPAVADVLGRIAHDTAAAFPERQIAVVSALQAGTRLTGRTSHEAKSVFVLASTTSTGQAPDTSDFAQAVRIGIRGAANTNGDSQLTAAELGQFVVARLADGRRVATQRPFWVLQGKRDILLSSGSENASRYGLRTARALVVAPVPPSIPLRTVVEEARVFTSTFEELGIPVLVLAGKSATLPAVEAAFTELARSMRPEELFIFCYTGAATVAQDGRIQWLLSREGEYLTPQTIRTRIQSVPANDQAVFANTCYAGAIADYAP